MLTPSRDLSTEVMRRHGMSTDLLTVRPAAGIASPKMTSSASLPAIFVKPSSLKAWMAEQEREKDEMLLLSQRRAGYRPSGQQAKRSSTPPWAVLHVPPLPAGRMPISGLPRPRPLSYFSVGQLESQPLDPSRPLAMQLAGLFVRRLKHVFESFHEHDKAHGAHGASAGVSWREFSSGLRTVGLTDEEAVVSLWQRLGKTPSGAIKFDELIAALTPRSLIGGDGRARAAFSDIAREHVCAVFRADGSGIISRYELAKGMALLGLSARRETFNKLFNVRLCTHVPHACAYSMHKYTTPRPPLHTLA